MGSKPNFSFLNFRPSAPRPSRALKAILLGALAAGSLAGLASCISDGPNKTGGEFLAKHGVLLRDSLMHITLKNMPVDSFWTTDALTARLGDGDQRHLGDTILLAGHSGDFIGEPRLSFQLTDTAMIDSLRITNDSGRITDTTALYIALSFPKPFFASEELIATLTNDTVRSEMRFEVSAWDSSDIGITGDQWSTDLGTWNRQYLYRQDTTAVLPLPSSRDTITLHTKEAYAHGDTLTQTNKLPNLGKQLLKAASNKHFLHLRLTALAGPGNDSGSAMLRLGGWLGDGAELRLQPLLLFGDTAKAAVATAKNRLQTMAIGTVRAVNYALKYQGPRTNMLTGRQRALHLTLDRARLLDSIDAALIRAGKTPQPRTTAKDFDLSYFVPLAKITLPLDHPKLEGGFPLEMLMSSSIDTLLGDTVGGDIAVDQVPTESRKVLWYTFEPGHPESILDEVSIGYDQIDSDLRRVTLKFSKDSSGNDTLFIHRSETKEWITTLVGGYGSSPISMSLTAGSTSLTVRSYLVLRHIAEPNNYLDPETGARITDLIRLMPHFLKPGDDAITLRATHGIQHMLNQVNVGATMLQDFIIQPSSSPAIDTSVATANGNVPDKVPYPILSVIPPKLNAGRLTVDVELYLFPLKAR